MYHNYCPLPNFTDGTLRPCRCPTSRSRLLPQLRITQRRATYLPHPTLPERASRAYSAALAVGRGRNGRDWMRFGGPRWCSVLCGASRRKGAHSSPRPCPRSRWNLNHRRAEAGSIDPLARHGEAGSQCSVPGARAACPLGAETRLHCPGAAGDRTALPGTAGAGGHVLRGDSESQGHPATSGAPGPVWALGAHLRRQPEQLKKNKRFRRFVRLQEGRPEFGSLHLQDLLPLPLQRLQQYENLVMALAENTGPNSPDHQQLTRAARLISETAQRVHSIGQRQKNDQHLRRVQALLSGRQAKGLTSGRWFLRQGWLLVVPPRGEPRPRMFFLFSDVLLMAKPRPPLHLLQSGTFACRALYPMAQCQLHRVFGHSGGPCGGLLSLSFPCEKLLLMSTDQEELLRWHHSLTLAISQKS
ncbi:rho guanine nucleotide exchange factor 39 isoform X2 [Panthera onca]